jgi:hypothetical protein
VVQINPVRWSPPSIQTRSRNQIQQDYDPDQGSLPWAQAESILIERIPGKPTVGIEVPNSKRELISLREILESDESSTPHRT